MRIKFWLGASLSAGLLVNGGAQAQAQEQAPVLAASAATPWSLGLQVMNANMGVLCNSSTLPCERNATSLGLYGAYALNAAYGLRLGWQQARRFNGSDVTGAGQSYGGKLDFDVFDLAATWRTELASSWCLELRAGAAAVHGHFEGAAGGALNASKNIWAPVVGVALEYPLQPGYALRLDGQYTQGQVANTADRLLSVGVGLVAHF
jgi:hypothetical protein